MNTTKMCRQRWGDVRERIGRKMLDVLDRYARGKRL